MPIFTASRMSNDRNVLYPDALAIDKANVIFYKGNPMGYETITIPRYAISGVYMHCGFLFADIIISSSGNAEIRAQGFKKSHAKQILNLLT